MTLRERVEAAAVDELPSIAAELAEAQAALTLRLHAPAKDEHSEDRLLEFSEVATMLGVPEDRARDAGRRGELPVVGIGKYRRVRLSAVRAYIKANEKPAYSLGKRR